MRLMMASIAVGVLRPQLVTSFAPVLRPSVMVCRSKMTVFLFYRAPGAVIVDHTMRRQITGGNVGC